MSTSILIVLDIVLVIIPLMAIVYFRTKSSVMKTAILVVLAVVSFLSLYAFVYAFYYQEMAKKAQIQAEMNLVLAEQARKLAENARIDAEDELAKCRGKK